MCTCRLRGPRHFHHSWLPAHPALLPCPRPVVAARWMRKSRCTTWHSAVVATHRPRVCARGLLRGVRHVLGPRVSFMPRGLLSVLEVRPVLAALSVASSAALRPTRAASCARTLLTVVRGGVAMVFALRPRAGFSFPCCSCCLFLGAPRACACDSCHSTHATSVGACFFVVVRASFVCVRVCVSGFGILMANTRCLWPRFPPAGRAIAPCARVCVVIAGCRPTPARA